MSTFEPIIGLEIHVELKTKSKMFCGCKNDPFFAKQPNIYTCPVCLGMPGGLPVPNRKAVEWTVMLGLALNCEIPQLSKFDRKNYFYPDLPKGYQISQYDQPLAINGWLKIRDLGSEIRKIRIRRVHLEEDTGKLLHATVNGKKVTLIDFNRSGVPLVEIVTEPDIRSAAEAKVFLKKLQQIIRYLGISDADMEKGSMRLEPNISVREIPNKFKHQNLKLPNYKVEVKNINSFRFAERAIDFEIKRQIGLLERDKTPIQETRGWSEGQAKTLSQRRKEEAADYRYFPESDIPPIKWEKSQVTNLKAQIGELPDEKKERFQKEYGLNDYDAALLTETRAFADFFEEAVKVSTNVHKGKITSKKIANWIINRKPDIDKILPAELVGQIRQAAQVAPLAAVELEKVVQQVIAENAQAVKDYKKGKEQALMFLIGRTIQLTQGKGGAEAIKRLLLTKLKA